MSKLKLDFISKDHIRGKLHYPNCPISKSIIDLMGRKAFTTKDLVKISNLMNLIKKELENAQS